MLRLFSCDLSLRDNDGKSALMMAIEIERLEITPRLISKSLEHGEDINIGDKYGRTALHYAFEYLNDDIVEQILSVGIEANAQDCDGMTALMVAIEKQLYKFIDELMNVCDLNTVDRNGWNASHYAAAYLKLEWTKRIAKHLPTQRTNENYSILHCAAKCGQKETVLWLLQSDISAQLMNTPEYLSSATYMFDLMTMNDSRCRNHVEKFMHYSLRSPLSSCQPPYVKNC